MTVAPFGGLANWNTPQLWFSHCFHIGCLWRVYYLKGGLNANTMWVDATSCECHKGECGKRLDLQRKCLGLAWKRLTPPRYDLKLCIPFPRSPTKVTRYHCFSYHPLNSVAGREFIKINLPTPFCIQGRAELDFHLPGKYPYAAKVQQ